MQLHELEHQIHLFPGSRQGSKNSESLLYYWGILDQCIVVRIRTEMPSVLSPAVIFPRGLRIEIYSSHFPGFDINNTSMVPLEGLRP